MDSLEKIKYLFEEEQERQEEYQREKDAGAGDQDCNVQISAKSVRVLQKSAKVQISAKRGICGCDAQSSHATPSHTESSPLQKACLFVCVALGIASGLLGLQTLRRYASKAVHETIW